LLGYAAFKPVVVLVGAAAVPPRVSPVVKMGVGFSGYGISSIPAIFLGVRLSHVSRHFCGGGGAAFHPANVIQFLPTEEIFRIGASPPLAQTNPPHFHTHFYISCNLTNRC